MQIDIRFNPRPKKCKEDFDGVSFICCKHLDKAERETLHTVASYSDSTVSYDKDDNNNSTMKPVQPSFDLMNNTNNLQVPAYQNNLFLQNTVHNNTNSALLLPDDGVGTTDDELPIKVQQRFATMEAEKKNNNDTTIDISSHKNFESKDNETAVVTIESKQPQSTNNNSRNDELISQVIKDDIFTLPDIEPKTKVEYEQVAAAPQTLSLSLIPPDNNNKVLISTEIVNKTDETRHISLDSNPNNQKVTESTTNSLETVAIELAKENSSSSVGNESQNLVLNVPTSLFDTSEAIIDNSTEINAHNFEKSTNSMNKVVMSKEGEAQVTEKQQSEEPSSSTNVEIKATTLEQSRKLYPFFHGMDHRESEYMIVNETGEKIKIPSQYYEPPSLTPEDLLKFILPPGSEALEESVRSIDPRSGSGSDIQLLSPLAGHNNQEYVEECPQGMKCLSEAYCSTMNPTEGDSDAFDIRLQFRKRSTRKKCRQPNLPVDGYCCYLRDDFASTITPTVNKQNKGVITKRLHEEEACGIRRPPVSNSEDKSSTNFGEFPWQALILRQDIGSQCGGAILNQRIIVTSATCLKNATLADIRIRVGEWDMESDLETKPHQEITPNALLVHPGFKSINSNLVHDIALIVTKEKIQFDYHVSRICLPEPIDRFEDQRCITTGWASSSSTQKSDSTMTKSLKQVPLPIISTGTCEMRLRKTSLGRNFNLHRTSVCAGGEPKNDPCMIDQVGAPLVCENSIGSYTLVGLTSWSNKCNQTSEPKVFTNVAIHTDWIYTILQKEPDDIISF